LNDKLVLMDAKLDLIIAALNAPDPVFSFSLCTEPAGNFEAQAGTETDVELKGEGRLGAEGFGNGLMARLLGSPKFKTGKAFKFGWDILKLGVCADLRAAIQRAAALRGTDGNGGARLLRAGLAADSGAAVTGGLLDQIPSLDEDALLREMLDLASTLQFDPQKLQNTLDAVSNVSFDGSPFSALQSDDPNRAALVEALPLPPNLRTLLADPAAVFNKFKELKETGLCNVSPRPPALDDLLGEICALAENERFSKLLDRVDDITGDINTTVGTVNTRVGTVLSRLPTDNDCKLFCHRFLFFGE
jgi:hypothetical protein